MADIKGILFDKDGTLFGYGQTWGLWCVRVLNEMAPDDMVLRRKLAEAAGYNLDTRDFVTGSLVVNAAADETNAAWAAIHPDLDFAQIERIGVAALDNLPAEPVCDLPALLRDLRAQGIKLGVATNDYEIGAEMQLKETGIRDLFDFVCGFDSGYGAKPMPGMVEGFAKAMGLDVSEVAMVGDSTHDLHAGRAAGAGLRVGVLTGPAEREDLVAHADVVLDSIETIATLL